MIRLSCHFLLPVLLLLSDVAESHDINTYNPDLGVYIGDLSSTDSDIGGQVFIINATALQIFNFTLTPTQSDLYFWFDVKDIPTVDGIKAHTVEYGITPIGTFPKDQDRIVVHVADKHKLDEFKSFSVYSFKSDSNIGSVTIPDNIKIPKSVALQSEFVGKRYKLRSGPVYVIDRRTIKIYGFTFEGNKAPKTFFYAGRGSTVSTSSGEKVAIRGKDENEITEITENYRGGKDIVLELPENYDIFHIDWLSVYCSKFRVNFGSVLVPSDDTLSFLPPYVPPVKSLRKDKKSTPTGILLGTVERRNFTFQLADASMSKTASFPPLRQPKYVWAVNSVVTPDLYLKRNVTYIFNIEGGRESSIPELYNPLYIGDDVDGGFSLLSDTEVKKINIFSADPVEKNVGPLCIWSHTHEKTEDGHNTYLECDGWPDDYNSITFTPTESTPAVLYYNSANNFNMGGRIFIVDDIPSNLTNAQETFYSREKWHSLALSREKDEKVNTAKTTAAATLMILVTILLA